MVGDPKTGTEYKVDFNKTMFITAYPNKFKEDTSFEFEFWVVGEEYGLLDRVYFRKEYGDYNFSIFIMFLILITTVCVLLYCVCFREKAEA